MGVPALNAALLKHDPKARQVGTIEDYSGVKDVIQLLGFRDIGLIDKGEWVTLQESLDLRNRCGHPTKYKPQEGVGLHRGHHGHCLLGPVCKTDRRGGQSVRSGNELTERKLTGQADAAAAAATRGQWRPAEDPSADLECRPLDAAEWRAPAPSTGTVWLLAYDAQAIPHLAFGVLSGTECSTEYSVRLFSRPSMSCYQSPPKSTRTRVGPLMTIVVDDGPVSGRTGVQTVDLSRLELLTSAMRMQRSPN